jgi:hypothetical protein
MTPLLNSIEGLTIATGEVTQNIPALTLEQKVNDGGESAFSALEIKLANTTEEENAAFVRGFFNGGEVFSIKGGTFSGREASMSDSVKAGFSSLSADTLNLAAQCFLTPDDSFVLAIKRGQNPQTVRVYNSENTNTGDAEYLSFNWSGNLAKIGTEKKAGGVERDLAIGVGSSNTIKLSSGNKVGFFGATPVVQPTVGVATAAATYGTNERDMLQRVYNAIRALGLGT